MSLSLRADLQMWCEQPLYVKTTPVWQATLSILGRAPRQLKNLPLRHFDSSPGRLGSLEVVDGGGIAGAGLLHAAQHVQARVARRRAARGRCGGPLGHRWDLKQCGDDEYKLLHHLERAPFWSCKASNYSVL